MKKFIFLIALFSSFVVFSQEVQKVKYQRVVIDDDSTFNGLIPEISVKASPIFKTTEEYYTYLRYKRYAEKVYPYAVQAVKAYTELKDSTDQLGYFARRRYVKDKQHELKSKFEDPLVNLTKGQGFVLIKMIERKLQKPMYEVVSDTKGSFTAVYWNILGSTAGYHLKDGYQEGKDRILDIVIDDYNIPD
jgi:Domain of unknown function (DUF4294)